MKTKKPCPHCDHVKKQIEKFSIREVTACICGKFFKKNFSDKEIKEIPYSEAMKKIQ